MWVKFGFQEDKLKIEFVCLDFVIFQGRLRMFNELRGEELVFGNCCREFCLERVWFWSGFLVYCSFFLDLVWEDMVLVKVSISNLVQFLYQVFSKDFFYIFEKCGD